MYRRSLLAKAGAAGATALAGCSMPATLGGSDDGPSYRQVSQWALAAGVEGEPPTGYAVDTVRPSAVLGTRATLIAEDITDPYGEASLWQRLDLRDVDLAIGIDTETTAPSERYRVFEGPLDPATLIEAITGRESVETVRIASYEGYDCYETPGRFYHAVTDGRAIEIDYRFAPELDRSVLDHLVDVGNGDGERMVDRDEGFAAAADRVDSRHYSRIHLPRLNRDPDVAKGHFEAVVAFGSAGRIRSDETLATGTFVFRDRAAREAAPIDRYRRALTNRGDVRKVSFDADGRFLTVEIVYPPGALFDD